MTQATPDRIRQDRRLIGQTLLKLALPRYIGLAAGIVIALIIWRYVSSWLLGLGTGIGLDWLSHIDWLSRILGSQGIEFLSHLLNPYLWWALAAVWTLIVLLILKSSITASLAASRLYTLDSRVLAQLRPRLCDEVVDVMRWVWDTRDEPFTVGDLRRTHRELRSNRIGKIALVRTQSAILDQASADTGDAFKKPEGMTHRAEPLFDRAR